MWFITKFGQMWFMILNGWRVSVCKLVRMVHNLAWIRAVQKINWIMSFIIWAGLTWFRT